MAGSFGSPFFHQRSDCAMNRNTPIESFELDEGYDPYGTHTAVKFEGDQAVKIRTFDAEPLLAQAHAERTATAGQRWGEMRKVGTIPMAIYAKALEIKEQTERTKFIRTWLQQNPALVSFDRYLVK